MDTKIDKWGNSLAIRIPKRILESRQFRKGTRVEVKAVENGILISRAETTRRPRRKRKYHLTDLLSRCAGPNPYRPISDGPAVGSEIF